MKNNTSTENISVNKLKSLCHKVFYLSSVGKLVHRRILEFIFFFPTPFIFIPGSSGGTWNITVKGSHKNLIMFNKSLLCSNKVN